MFQENTAPIYKQLKSTTRSSVLFEQEAQSTSQQTSPCASCQSQICCQSTHCPALLHRATQAVFNDIHQAQSHLMLSTHHLNKKHHLPSSRDDVQPQNYGIQHEVNQMTSVVRSSVSKAAHKAQALQHRHTQRSEQLLSLLTIVHEAKQLESNEESKTKKVMVQEALKEFFKIPHTQSSLKRREAKIINSQKAAHHLKDMTIKNRMALLTMSKSKSSPLTDNQNDSPFKFQQDFLNPQNPSNSDQFTSQIKDQAKPQILTGESPSYQDEITVTKNVKSKGKSQKSKGKKKSNTKQQNLKGTQNSSHTKPQKRISETQTANNHKRLAETQDFEFEIQQLKRQKSGEHGNISPASQISTKSQSTTSNQSLDFSSVYGDQQILTNSRQHQEEVFYKTSASKGQFKIQLNLKQIFSCPLEESNEQDLEEICESDSSYSEEPTYNHLQDSIFGDQLIEESSQIFTNKAQTEQSIAPHESQITADKIKTHNLENSYNFQDKLMNQNTHNEPSIQQEKYSSMQNIDQTISSEVFCIFQQIQQQEQLFGLNFLVDEILSYDINLKKTHSTSHVNQNCLNSGNQIKI
eukprot:403333983